MIPHTNDRYKFDESFIRDILKKINTIAVVGLSENENRPSYFAAKYLKSKGYQIIPVNPITSKRQILGSKVYKSLEEIEKTPDMIDLFIKPEKVIPFVKQAIKIRTKVIWMQIGVINYEAAKLARKAKIDFVMDRCPKIEYARLSGELGWAGINTKIINNKIFPIK